LPSSVAQVVESAVRAIGRKSEGIPAESLERSYIQLFSLSDDRVSSLLSLHLHPRLSPNPNIQIEDNGTT
jgi:hypothetical protein